MKIYTYQQKKNFNAEVAELRRGVKIILILFFTLIFTMACTDPENEFRNVQFIPVGEWVTDWDEYFITNSLIIYDDTIGGFPFYGFTGEIVAAVDFTKDSGVIIVKIKDTPAPVSATAGKYTGIYYSNVKSSSINLTMALNIAGNYEHIEKDSLSEALSIFTPGNRGNHIGQPGLYTAK